MSAVAIIGAATLLLAGCSALVQYDLKRILAYSTISQIGYMFLALGVGAWAAAIYHFATHAFFKAALFLGAGVVLKTLGEEHDIFKMGGLRRRYPLTFWAFVFAALTLAAVPPLTLTFNSKDLILNEVWLSGPGGRTLWALALVGAFLTAAYTFRLVFAVFFGPERTRPQRAPTRRMVIPFLVLAVLGLAAGFPELLSAIFGVKGFYYFLQSTMPERPRDFPATADVWIFQGIYVATALAGIALVYLLYGHASAWIRSVLAVLARSPLHRWWFADWGFDWLYHQLFVNPFVRLAQWNRRDFTESFYRGLAQGTLETGRLLAWTVTGNVRWYVAAVAGGAALIAGLVVLL